MLGAISQRRSAIGLGLMLAILLLASPVRGADEVVVHSGDTLSGIAAQYGVTVAELVAWNHVANPRLIHPGQRLLLHAPAVPPPPPPPPAQVTHVVAHGETLIAIATQYHVYVADIVAANHITNPSFIRTGQRLLIPGVAASVSLVPKPPAQATGPALSPATAAAMAARSAMRDKIVAAAIADDIPVALALAVAWHESGWRQEAVSGAGAVGVMQLMPATADWVGKQMLGEAPRISDTTWNIRAGVRLLDFYLHRYGGNREKVLAAYYQGMTALERDGIYPSSVRYITDVMALEAMLLH